MKLERASTINQKCSKSHDIETSVRTWRRHRNDGHQPSKWGEHLLGASVTTEKVKAHRPRFNGLRRNARSTAIEIHLDMATVTYDLSIRSKGIPSHVLNREADGSDQFFALTQFRRGCRSSRCR